jgi:hypothetical protein
MMAIAIVLMALLLAIRAITAPRFGRGDYALLTLLILVVAVAVFTAPTPAPGYIP